MLRNVAILTSADSWFIPYAKELVFKLRTKGYSATLFNSPHDINSSMDVVFILSFFQKVDDVFLKSHKYTLVVHESDLPHGKGWAPMIWQIIEGKSEITVCLLEAASKIDSGRIFLREIVEFSGYELHNEIRSIQVQVTEKLCLKFLENYDKIIPIEQRGNSTFYRKRNPNDSQLEVDKTIREQFNLLRTVSNKDFPAFFILNGHKYVLEIKKYDDKF